MSNTRRLSRMAGLAVAAATLLAVAPLGVASADPVNIDMSAPGNIETITITTDAATGTGTAKIDGHSFKAVRIGNYQNATGTVNSGDPKNSTLSNVAVTTVDGTNSVLTGAEAAMRATGASADQAYTGNPVGQVAADYLGYASSSTTNTDTTSGKAPYDGTLRSFVTSLVKQSDFQTALGNATAYKASNGTATITGLTPGIYVVEDVTTARGKTDGPKNAIPMLLGTAITIPATNGGVDTVYNNIDGKPLGTVSMKADSPSVTKTMGTVNKPSIGSYIPYTLTTTVPLATGFNRYLFTTTDNHYLFTMTDQPSAGLKFVTGTINGTDYTPVVKANGTTLTAGTDYQVTTASKADGDTTYVLFDLSKYAKNTAHYGEKITVDYHMQISSNANAETNLSNGVVLSYSSDPADPPLTDKPVPDTDGVPKDNGNDGDCAAGQTTPCGDNNETITNNDKVPSTGGDNNEGKIYIKHFNLRSKAKSDDTLLPGATFTVTEKTGTQANEPIKFIKQSDGFTYKKAADQNDTNATSTLTVPSDANKGKLQVDGLAESDTYTVEETAAPTGYNGTFKPSFDVTTATGDANTYTNTGDTWGLVTKHTAATDADSAPIVVYAVNGISQLPLTGGAGAILGVVVAVLLLGTAGCLYALKRRESSAASANAVATL